ncbi:MAG: flagellar hook-associated protein FlgK [Sedimentibacter sp.]|uniref:flagellar hook-associated protein FlgK n=1 Tax=Sedimentibacter sp. TaxID=1960295 RepID=UPI0031592727
MLRSTFLGFKTATSALTVSQNQMDVVGQNISNVNTQGYTRQRLDINSVSFSTSNLKYGINGVIIGQGVAASGVSQYRDSFLDLRYRTEAAKVGSQEVQLEAFSDLEEVLDEITTDGLDAQFSDLLEQLHSLTSSPSDPVLEGVVRTSAELLTQMFNNYSEQISTIREQQLTYLHDGAVEQVNQLLKNISELNDQIKADNISGNPALELNDKRNTLIDELSGYLNIEVSIEPLDIGGGKSIDETVIKLKLSDGSKVNIVDRDKYAEFSSSVEDGSSDVNVLLTKNIDESNTNTNLTDLIDKGQIGGYIKFLNGKGEFADSTDVDSQTKGVQYYQKMLDTLANKFATVMNEVNGSDKPLFDKRNGDAITASNIKIADSWAKSSGSYIKNTAINTEGDSTGATDNILTMISKFQSDMEFKTSDSADTSLFVGTFQEFLSFTTTRLNLQVADIQTSYDTYSETQYQIEYARSSMSSVDLNEEGVNLLTYSKSYNAAARLMTTLDEMLDTLINEMAR